MPEFAYTARDLSGQKKTGVLTANSQHEALVQLDTMALMPVEITAAKNAEAVRGKKVSGQVMANVYNQLSALLRSGVPLLRALTVMSQQATKPALKAVLEEVKAKVEDGEPMPDVMARYPRTFSNMAVNMVRAGTEGGFLEDALERVATFTEQQEDLKGRAAGALAYPIFLACVGTAVVSVLIIFFVPKFEPLFAGLREQGQLPFATDLLLGFSAFLQSYWFVPIAAIVFSLFAAVAFLNTDRGQRR